MKKRLVLTLALAATLIACLFVTAQAAHIVAVGEDTAHWEAEEPVPQPDEAQLTAGKLGTPVQLTWGKDWNGYNDNLVNRPGYFAWKVDGACTGCFEIKIYNTNNRKDPVFAARAGWPRPQQAWYTDTCFIEALSVQDLPSGTYYFTVQCLDSNYDSQGSPVATSPEWKYTRPNVAVPAPTNLRWNGTNILWDMPKSSVSVELFDLDWLWSPYTTATPEICSGEWGSVLEIDGSFASRLDDWVTNFTGTGYYYAQIRAISPDITRWRHSELSPLSAPFFYAKEYPEVLSALEALLNSSSASVSYIRDTVQNLPDLREAIADGQGQKGGVVDKLAALEQKMSDVQLVTQVDPALTDVLPAADISVVGAKLNNTADDASPIIFKVSPAEFPIYSNYKSASAVRFSLSLEGVSNPDSLDVPVQVVLPLPATLDPESLVVLRNIAQWELEHCDHRVYQENGKWFVSMLLEQGGEFALTGPSTRLTEDMFTVDVSDAYYTGEYVYKSISAPGLVEDQDYYVRYESRYRPGVATIFIYGKGDYDGTLQYHFSILNTTSDYITNGLEWMCAEDGKYWITGTVPEGETLYAATFVRSSNKMSSIHQMTPDVKFSGPTDDDREVRLFLLDSTTYEPALTNPVTIHLPLGR